MTNYASTFTQHFSSIKARKDGSDKEDLFETNVLPAVEKALSLGTLGACTAKTSRASFDILGKLFSLCLHQYSGSTFLSPFAVARRNRVTSLSNNPQWIAYPFSDFV